MATLRRRLLFQLVTNQRLEQQVRRSPTLQRRAYAAARRYVAGETIQDMLQVVAGLRTDPILEIVTALAAQGAPPMATVQANLRRNPQDLARLAAAGVPVRLCKGA